MRIWWSLFSYGGLSSELLECYLKEIAAFGDDVAMRPDHVRDDALISRSRSVAMSRFLDSDCDVHFQLDHDILWNAGDVVATCRKALEQQAVVGGMYSVRSRSEGHAGRFAAASVIVKPGADQLVLAEFVGGGFTAYPRSAVERTLRDGIEFQERMYSLSSDFEDPRELANFSSAKCMYVDGTPFYDFFRPIVIDSRVWPGYAEMLSEDWSFCERARSAGNPLYIWTKPVLQHVGEYHYTVVEAARPTPAKPQYASDGDGETK